MSKGKGKLRDQIPGQPVKVEDRAKKGKRKRRQRVDAAPRG